MQKQLDLTASQSDEITKLIKASQDRTKPLWDQISPQLRVEMKRVREEIRQVLNPDQQKKYDELLKRARKPDGTNSAPGRPSRQPADSPPQTNSL
jgi:Spy/CpxP family protein refolding chaperone